MPTKTTTATRSPPRSGTSHALADQDEQPTRLCLLPDVPLLLVLHHLPLRDLLAAGQASPRLGATTRAHPSLWRGKDSFERCESIARLLRVLRVAPPADRLELRVVNWKPIVGVHFRCCASALEARVPEAEMAVSVVLELGPTLRHLDVAGLELGVLFASLQDARRLETLRVRDLGESDFEKPVTSLRPRQACLRLVRYCLCSNSRGPVPGVAGLTRRKQPPGPRTLLYWPREVVLPRLHSVVLGRRFVDGRKVGLEALRSLLQAHSQQLRSVTLYSESLLPLLDACPSDLQRLQVAAGKGAAARLRRLQGLQELAIGTNHWGLHIREVKDVLRSWPGQLERLELSTYCEVTLRVLGAGGLASLQHLVLDNAHCPTSCLQALAAALAGLPRLRSLALVLRGVRGVPQPTVFVDIPGAAIPALELLVVAGRGDCGSQYQHEEDCRVAWLVPVLQDVVRRAPAPLHVVFQLQCGRGRLHGLHRLRPEPGPEAVVEDEAEDNPVPVFFRHSAGKAETDCALCAEAAAAVAARSVTERTVQQGFAVLRTMDVRGVQVKL